MENKHNCEHSQYISISELVEIKTVIKEFNTILSNNPIKLDKPVDFKL